MPNTFVILPRLSLDSQVDLKKLRYFTIADDGGSLFTYPVDKELIEAQRKVRPALHSPVALNVLLGELEVKCQDVLQVVQRLEAELGVKVQEVQLPGLRYGFQIWNTYMGLPDKDGNVGSKHQHKAENSNCPDMIGWLVD